MNKAVRLHHPTLRNCVLTLERQSMPNSEPLWCPACNEFHLYDTHHLNIDAHGNVCVSQEVYEAFKADGILEDLVATKEVVPRPTVITLPTLDFSGGAMAPGQDIVHPATVFSREHGLVRADGLYLPRPE